MLNPETQICPIEKLFNLESVAEPAVKAPQVQNRPFILNQDNRLIEFIPKSTPSNKNKKGLSTGCWIAIGICGCILLALIIESRKKKEDDK